MAVVLITGCSSGFGLEVALAFARRGDTVCATMRNLAKADALRKHAADEGVEVDLEALDAAQAGRLGGKAATRLGSVAKASVSVRCVTPPRYWPGVGLRTGGQRPEVEAWVRTFYAPMYRGDHAAERRWTPGTGGPVRH